MRYFERLEEPKILKDNWERLGSSYAKRCAKNPRHSFTWPTVSNTKINHHILPSLLQQTQKHCSYCDRFFEFSADHSIDHFKPKSDARFHAIAYKWDNLYLCCDHCQRAKGSLYDKDILRPDEAGYSFSRYFVYNPHTYQIDVSPKASISDKQRAEKTIKVFNFNASDYKTARRRVLLEYNTNEGFAIDEYNFRFLFQ